MPFKTKIRGISALVLMLLATAISYGQQAEGQVRIETSARIDAMVAQKKEYNKNLKDYEGYRIQIYYGREKECYEMQEEFTERFPDIPTLVLFSTPQWKLQVGNYRTRLDADRAVVSIKKEYPAAIVLATKIGID